jgi:hypothetical protein
MAFYIKDFYMKLTTVFSTFIFHSTVIKSYMQCYVLSICPTMSISGDKGLN